VCCGRVPPDDRYGRIVYCMDGSVVWFVMYMRWCLCGNRLCGACRFYEWTRYCKYSTAKYAHYCMGTLINKNIITLRTLHKKVWVNVSHLETIKSDKVCKSFYIIFFKFYFTNQMYLVTIHLAIGIITVCSSLRRFEL
jgi:hypothetical protein